MRTQAKTVPFTAGTVSAASGEEILDERYGLTLTATLRLQVRKFSTLDAADYFEIFSNPNICKFDDFDPINRVAAQADVDRIVANYGSDAEENEYAVVLRTRNKVIGVLSTREEGNALYVGYHFNEKFHGKGYALEAMSMFLFWLYKNTDREILAVTDIQNERSINLLVKIGFEFVRTVSKVINGERVTECLYRYAGTLQLQS